MQRLLDKLGLFVKPTDGIVRRQYIHSEVVDKWIMLVVNGLMGGILFLIIIL